MRRILLVISMLWGCGAPPPPAPVLDAGFLDQYAATHRLRAGQPANIAVAPDAVFFLQSGPRSREQDLYTFQPGQGVRRLLTAAELMGSTPEKLSPEEQARRERMRLSARGIARFSLSDDGSTLLFPLAGRYHRYDRATGQATPIGPAGAQDAVLSPTGRDVAIAEDGHVVVYLPNNDRRVIMVPNLQCGVAEFVAQEEMGRFAGMWWSPDGQRVIFQCTDDSRLEIFHVADPQDPAKPPQTQRYPRAGKANAEVRLFVEAVERIQEIHWDRRTFPYVADVVWAKNAPPVLVVQDRTQQILEVLRVEPDTGKTSVLLRETDPAWVHPGDLRWLPDGSGFLWASEREGAWCLELRGADGALKRRLTDPALGLRRVVQVVGEAVFVLAGPDPTQQHLYRVPLAGGPAQALTEAPGLHGVVTGGGDLVVHTEQPEAGPPRWWVRTLPAAGPLPAPLAELSSKAERPTFTPTPEWVEVEGEAGRTHHAVVLRPRNFLKGKRYPVLVQVYGGPGAQMVRRFGDGLVFDQWLADHGFIVVRADGRGTPNRGRDWERAIRGDLIGPALADQVAAVQALGRKYPEMDMNRVGIQGWSFGGYFAALAVMLRPDVFHAAVAGAPVADWRDYDTHYTERFLGLPDADAAAYDRSSVLTHAPRLARPLLIVHGTADDNVYFLHALKLSNALFRAGKVHDFLPLSGLTHMVVEAEAIRALQGRIVGFFQQHLVGE